MSYSIGDQIQMTILKKTPLGYNVKIDDHTEGLLYENDVYQALTIGEERIGYIKMIREDGKIDVSIRPQGFRNAIDADCDRIVSALKQEKVLMVSDKSSPEEIKMRFEMSKKAFKKAIGFLYKRKVIVIKEDRIEFFKNENKS